MIKARSVRTAVVGMVFGLMLGLTANPSASAVTASSSASYSSLAVVATTASPQLATVVRVRDTRPPSVCLGKPGRTICVSKLDRRLYAIYNGRVVKYADARYGGLASDGTRNFTREGTFQVNWKLKSKRSTAYNVMMYNILAFSGAQYIHYSSEFAQYGWKYGSHGCVGLRSWDFSAWLYNWAPTGTRVIVTPN